jgi:ABC-2 type transport system ATP-binding protein
MGPVIELRGLTKVFGRTRAVDDLTCSIEPGVVTGFLGPNGAGKSTTMRMIVGLDRPTAGSATIGGREYHELHHPLRTVGALLDAKQVHPNRTARNHLRWIAASNRLPDNRVDEVLAKVGLSDVAGKKAGTFSLGMSQRLGIAAAPLGDHAYEFTGVPWFSGFTPWWGPLGALFYFAGVVAVVFSAAVFVINRRDP